MTVRDFTTHFRIGRTSFYREVQAGRLHIVKFGRSTLIAKTDAMAWLENLSVCSDAVCSNDRGAFSQPF